MTLPETLQFVTAFCAVASAGCAVLVARRAQRWRDTDEAQKLMDRIDEAESRLDRVDGRLADVPNKADLATVRGEIHAVARTVDQQVVPGLQRIEGYFLEAGVRSK
ncbi:DUF2730 family protein [Brevundimonas sp.]|uniref:DUF2730 family protein n=1 Tax=Brevundimonas sp. TaxID=1871086 RepID=UPI003D6CA78C